MRIEPTLRPELTSVVASVALPAYLGHPEAQCEGRARRGGLAGPGEPGDLHRHGQPRAQQRAGRRPAGSRPRARPCRARRRLIEGSRKIEFRWQDKFGLAGKEPFTLAVTAREDEAPSLACEDLPRQKVVLDTEQLSFKVRAQDDFGIKHIGIDWQGIENPIVATPAKGERILSAGGHDKDSLEISGTFSAKSLGIEPQPVNVRLFVEDYLPGRAAGLFADLHVLRLERRAARHLDHRAAQQVAPAVARGARPRDAVLRDQQAAPGALAPKSSTSPRPAGEIENQATAERANGRRLSGLVGLRRRPDQAGDAQPGVRHRPPGKMGRDAADLEGHRRQSDAVGRRPAARGGPGAERGHRRRRTTTSR